MNQKTTKMTTKTASIIAGLLLISSLIGQQQIDAVVESDWIVLDPTTCENLFDGIWADGTCTSSENTFDGKIRVSDGVTWIIIGKFVNDGAIVIDGSATMVVNGWGTSSNGKVINNGVIVNDGTLECKRCGFSNQNTMINSGVIDNHFKMSSNNTFYNLGTIHNHDEFLNRGNFFSCEGTVAGNPIGINPPVPTC
ncbi:MAG: hypothetical protein OEX98_01255 [Nitrosopumilus sp.]|nr:hypothetical protein [Nitrosopumilus sp.]